MSPQINEDDPLGYNPDDFYDYFGYDDDSTPENVDLNDDISDKKEKEKKAKYHKDKFWNYFLPDLPPGEQTVWINYLQATLGYRFKDRSAEPIPEFNLGKAPLLPWHGDPEFHNLASFYELEARRNIDRLNSEKKDKTKRKQRKLDFTNWVHELIEMEKDGILNEREKNLLKWHKEHNR